ncbi:MAG: 16S rRNA (cytidine(1402)-2'-O)-methyltransferase [Bordetella sp.]|nr:MAG: 16S rRNA (cytidine(1402)-2'-O)-methyltransferase [Bordetella sp.]
MNTFSKKNEILFKIFDRLENQSWPDSSLYVVATPIGNLADMNLRAWEALMRADFIAVENMRVSRILLDFWGIKTPLIIANKHNEATVAELICNYLQKRNRLALISDAGAPGISDPGGRIVSLVRKFGYRVIPIPGANSVVTALMGSGITTDKNPSYAFAGFIPKRYSEKISWLRFWCNFSIPIVMFETPKRLIHSLEDLLLICGQSRLLTIARELTKCFEHISSLKLGDIQEWVHKEKNQQRGEFVLILHPIEHNIQQKYPEKFDFKIDSLLNILLEEMSIPNAVKIAIKLTGLSHKDLYAQALMCKNHNNIRNYKET